MIRSLRSFSMFVALVIFSAACSPAPAATPQAAAGGTSVPAATYTLVPVPAQPTSATLAPRAPTAFVSPTPATRIGLSGSTTIASAPAATNPPPTAAAAAPAQPATSAGPIPTAPGVASGKRSEIKLSFLTPLVAAEEAEPPELVAMRTEFKKIPGFIDVSGDEMSITVGFDAGLVTPEQLIAKFADLKHPVKRS